ncbi:MAG: DUF2318 domain-containing protein [Deltaproteobacteria bacterium]|jgi:uncharacterized membrane protein|nr:DUF2318 domain-containing protein [Deltaproteobacteria bacterium]
MFLRKLFFICLFSLSCGGAALAAWPSIFGGEGESVRAEGGLIRVDVSALGAGQAKHYSYREGRMNVRFFLVRDSGNTIRAALDACEVCWKEDKGYKQQDSFMRCVNCGQKFPLTRIGEVKGGCNPHPLRFDLKDDIFSIPAAELAREGERYFKPS